MNTRSFYRICLSPTKKFISSQSESRQFSYCKFKKSRCSQIAKPVSADVRSSKFLSTGARISKCISTDNCICGFVETSPSYLQIRLFSFSTNSRGSENTSQQPRAQTTIDEEEVSHFNRLAALWWDESGEFEALHALNELRVPLIKDALVSLKTLDQYDVTKPLDGFWILDIGSGGGILCEPLARLGASVIGIDASDESTKIAKVHLAYDPTIRDKVKYINCTVEEIAESQAGKFDAVVASEVIEHVMNASMFVTCACKLVRPGGSIFFTTLNKTRLAYILGIVAAERLLRVVPSGTHDWEKFVPPADLQKMLEKNNFSTRLIHGMLYNPITNWWSWIKDTSVCYALHAVRPTSDGQENVWVAQDSGTSPVKERK